MVMAMVVMMAAAVLIMILVIVVVMPVDILCPPKVMQLFNGWQLNLWLLLFLWLRMCWTAFIRIPEPMKRVGAA